MERNLKSKSKKSNKSRLEKIRGEIRGLELRILESVQMDNWSIEPRILSDEEECRVSYSLPEAK